MRQVLADFSISLGRIRSLADNINANVGAALADVQVRELHETQQCGAIVLLTGYFEAFLKDLVRRFIEELSGSGVAFSALPEAIRNCHFEGGGRVLTKASEAARKRRAVPFGNATREDIAARLHSAGSAGGSYQIVWEAFADTEANPGPDVVKGIGQRLGLKEFWRVVSAEIGNPSRWSDTALTNELADLIYKRNECAHTGRVSPVPPVTDVLKFCDMLEALACGFVGALETQLAGYVPGTPGGS